MTQIAEELEGLDEENREAAEAFLHELRQRRLLLEPFVSVFLGDLTTRWPEHALFGEVWEGQIHVNQVDRNFIAGVDRVSFNAAEAGRACDLIERIVRRRK